jgi:hypothetical protein
MNYPLIPSIVPDVTVGAQPVHENELIDAIQIVVLSARANGQTLEEVTAEILADDQYLEPKHRQLLNEIVIKAWEQVPNLTPLASTNHSIVPALVNPTHLEEVAETTIAA